MYILPKEKTKKGRNEVQVRLEDLTTPLSVTNRQKTK